MAILPGFEYDIFISYRHNDNRSGWVTEFVKALQEELAATIKEPVSVYFDVNPHDGLLETHNVDKSLEGKLNCLIFIPIISQTYCDTKSFAWQHEFCAFNKMAIEGTPLSPGEGKGVRPEFGRDIKLSNGNVSSRILPIKIHDVDAADKTLLENELGGVLRAIEFIFKSPGVNRPLRSNEDHPQDNLNKTFYRDQINKVANAIKEIIGSLQEPKKIIGATTTGVNSIPKPSAPKKMKWIAIASLLPLALLAGWWFYNRAAVPVVSQSIKESRIAVLPFENKTNDTELDVLGDMAADFITQGLMDLDMKVVTPRSAKENIKLASLTPEGEVSPDFAQRTGAETLVKGRFYKQSEELIFQIQITDALTGEVAMAMPEIKGKKADLHGLVTELRERLLTAFSIRQAPSNSALSSKASPPKFAAYKNFEEAMIYYYRDWERSKTLLKKSISEDSSFAMAYILTGFAYKATNAFTRADSMVREIDSRFPHLSAYESLMLDQLRVELQGGLEEAYQQAKKGFNKDPKDFLFNFVMGVYTTYQNRPEEALYVFKQIDLSSFDFSNTLQVDRVIFYAVNLIRLNYLDKAKRVLRTVPFEKRNGEFFGMLAHIYILQNQPDSLNIFFHDLENRGLDKKILSRACVIVSQGFTLKKEEQESQFQWATRSLGYLRESNLKETESFDLARSLYLSGQLQAALDMYEHLNAKKPDTYLLSTMGCIYAKLGKVDKAKEQIREIEKLDNKYNWPHISFPKARIHAALGEKEKAMNLIRQASKDEIGSTFSIVWAWKDYELINLFDYPPYQEFIKPKG